MKVIRSTQKPYEWHSKTACTQIQTKRREEKDKRQKITLYTVSGHSKNSLNISRINDPLHRFSKCFWLLGPLPNNLPSKIPECQHSTCFLKRFKITPVSTIGRTILTENIGMKTHDCKPKTKNITRKMMRLTWQFIVCWHKQRILTLEMTISSLLWFIEPSKNQINHNDFLSKKQTSQS